LPLPLLEPVSAELFAMGNLLGDVWISQGQTRGDLAADAAEAPGDALSLAPWASAPHVLAITLYGKETARMGRKMGHFTLKSPQARSVVTEFREALARACVTLSRV
jgi:phosphoribosylaminoimidazole carboxylase (NCAIR synthetase)